MRARNRFGHGLTAPELRETRDAALFHQAGATNLANSTITRVTAHARLATARYAQDLGVDLATVIDTATTHHVAVAVAAHRLTGERRANPPLAEVKNRLLARARLSLAPPVRPARQANASRHIP
jgi:hypothetical protein